MFFTPPAAPEPPKENPFIPAAPAPAPAPAAASPFGAAAFPPAVVARDQFEFATPELSTFQTGRVRKLLDDAIQATLTGQKSPADALNAAQAEADKLLKSYR